MFSNVKEKLFLYIGIVGAVVLSVGIGAFTGYVIGLGLLVVFLIPIWFFRNALGNVAENRKQRLLNVLLSMALVFLLVRKLGVYFDSKAMGVGHIFELLVILGLVMYLAGFCYKITRLYLMRCRSYKRDGIDALSLVMNTLLLTFFMFIFLPSSLYLNNRSEFFITYQCLVFSMVFRGICFGIILFMLIYIIPNRLYKYAVSLLGFFNLASYIQFLLLNGGLGEIDGMGYNWHTDMVRSVVSSLLFGAALILSIVIAHKYNKLLKSLYYTALGLLGILVVSCVMLIATNSKSSFFVDSHVYDYSDEFALASGENVIVMILDAVDNDYIEAIMKEDEAFFDDFSDYTLYTNTCAVYDYTAPSMSQLFSGYSFGDSAEYSDEIYRRIKEDGFCVKFYGFDYDSRFPEIYDYIDNCSIGNLVEGRDYNVEHDKVYNDFFLMSLYQCAPCVFKGYIDANDLEFDHILSSVVVERECFANEKFLHEMNHFVNSDMDKLFVMHHIQGAHQPCDGYIESTRYSLDICKRLNSQLKDLGLYDDATIIIMADHGLHDQHEPYVWPTASSPLFMIKEPNCHRDSIQISNAPIYHKDFLSTILVNMNLFDYDDDYIKIGNSIYDFDEDELRERYWCDSCDEGYRVYTYIGGYDELKRCVSEDIYEMVSY